MTYNELMAEAESYYKDVANNSPFCAIFEARKYIASKIDLCEDRNEHLNVLNWDEYIKEFAPMKRADYERRKCVAKENYENELKRIEDDWMNKGINSPDYHKI